MSGQVIDDFPDPGGRSSDNKAPADPHPHVDAFPGHVREASLQQPFYAPGQSLVKGPINGATGRSPTRAEQAARSSPCRSS